ERGGESGCGGGLGGAAVVGGGERAEVGGGVRGRGGAGEVAGRLGGAEDDASACEPRVPLAPYGADAGRVRSCGVGTAAGGAGDPVGVERERAGGVGGAEGARVLGGARAPGGAVRGWSADAAW